MRKILICDYPNALESSYELTMSALKKSMGKCYDKFEITVLPYRNEEDFIKNIADAEGLITAFVPIGEHVLSKAEKLTCISVSAVGYGNIDCMAAKKHGVTVLHIEEYCTQEVAEHTISLMCALNRHLKYYDNEVNGKQEWKYHTIAGERTLSRQTLAVFGFGRIGKRVAALARAFGMEVLAIDPYAKDVAEYGVELVSKEEAFKRADVITNHMNLTEENRYFFDREAFTQMEKKPVFINVGRGACVKEEDLAWALDEGKVRAVGLDVLEAEKPDLSSCRLLGRENVIITPHSAFYSADSVEALQRISGENLGYFFMGNMEKIFSVVPECRCKETV